MGSEVVKSISWPEQIFVFVSISNSVPSKVVLSRMLGGNSKPEMFLAKESNVDLCKYSPGDAQKFLSLFELRLVNEQLVAILLGENVRDNKPEIGKSSFDKSIICQKTNSFSIEML
jgi:hypothetical protein